MFCCFFEWYRFVVEFLWFFDYCSWWCWSFVWRRLGCWLIEGLFFVWGFELLCWLEVVVWWVFVLWIVLLWDWLWWCYFWWIGCYWWCSWGWFLFWRMYWIVLGWRWSWFWMGRFWICWLRLYVFGWCCCWLLGVEWG